MKGGGAEGRLTTRTHPRHMEAKRRRTIFSDTRDVKLQKIIPEGG